EAPPAEYPTWAAEPAPDAAADAVSRREEAIAEVLRTALAEGHSDETLADILRKVLASNTPHVALPEAPAVAAPQLSAPEPLWTGPSPGITWTDTSEDGD